MIIPSLFYLDFVQISETKISFLSCWDYCRLLFHNPLFLIKKDKQYFGIDVSKDVFDVMSSNGMFYQFENKHKAFRAFLRFLDAKSPCVMEATGYYHCRLAYFLQDDTIMTSVENPLSIKRFIQMKLSKIKTDRTDAKMICQYAQSVELKLWQSKSENQIECLQINRALNVYTKPGSA